MMKYIVACAGRAGLGISENGLSLNQVNGCEIPAGLLFTNSDLTNRAQGDGSARLVQGFSIKDLKAVFPVPSDEEDGENKGHLCAVISRISGALNVAAS